jgi:uncharacterized protein DUF6482
MLLEKLRELAGVTKIELHGIDLSYYVIYVVDGDALTPVVDKNGASLRFHSQHAARMALKEIGVTQFDFVHRSAYDEMVGLQTEGSDTEMRLTVKL